MDSDNDDVKPTFSLSKRASATQEKTAKKENCVPNRQTKKRKLPSTRSIMSRLIESQQAAQRNNARAQVATALLEEEFFNYGHSKKNKTDTDTPAKRVFVPNKLSPILEECEVIVIDSDDEEGESSSSSNIQKEVVNTNEGTKTGKVATDTSIQVTRPSDGGVKQYTIAENDASNGIESPTPRNKETYKVNVDSTTPLQQYTDGMDSLSQTSTSRNKITRAKQAGSDNVVKQRSNGSFMTAKEVLDSDKTDTAIDDTAVVAAAEDVENTLNTDMGPIDIEAENHGETTVVHEVESDCRERSYSTDSKDKATFAAAAASDSDKKVDDDNKEENNTVVLSDEAKVAVREYLQHADMETATLKPLIKSVEAQLSIKFDKKQVNAMKEYVREVIVTNEQAKVLKRVVAKLLPVDLQGLEEMQVKKFLDMVSMEMERQLDRKEKETVKDLIRKHATFVLSNEAYHSAPAAAADSTPVYTPVEAVDSIAIDVTVQQQCEPATANYDSGTTDEKENKTVRAKRKRKTSEIVSDGASIHGKKAGKSSLAKRTKVVVEKKASKKAVVVAKRNCSMCRHCPCTIKTSNNASPTSTSVLGINLTHSDANIEKSLIQEAVKIEKVIEQFITKEDTIRRKLKRHRRDMWRKREELIAKGTRLASSSSAAVATTRFLPHAEECDKEYETGGLCGSPSKEKAVVEEVKAKIFPKLPHGQVTLTQVGACIRKGTGQTDTDLNALSTQGSGSIRSSQQLSDTAVVDLTDELNKEYEVTTQAACAENIADNATTTTATQRDDTDHSSNVYQNDVVRRLEWEGGHARVSSDKLQRVAVQAGVWKSVVSEDYSSGWDRLFDLPDDGCMGINELIGMIDKSSATNVAAAAAANTAVDDTKNDNEGLPSSNEDAVIDITKLSADEVKLVDRIVAEVESDETMMRQLDRSCPDWKDNVVYAIRQKDSKLISLALSEVESKKERIEYARKRLLEDIDAQQAALSLFHKSMTLSLQAARDSERREGIADTDDAMS